MAGTPIHVYHARAEAICAVIRDVEPSRTVIALSDEAELREAIGGVEVLLVDTAPSEIWASAHRMRFVQCLGAGADGVLPAEGLPPTASITCLRGVFAHEAAEHAIMVLLALRRGLATHITRQRARSWNAFPSGTLAGDTLAIVGLGAVGSRVATLATALDMRVLGISRTAGARRDVPRGTRVSGPESLHEILRSSDHVLVSAPLTRATRGMIGESELALLRRSALIVNVARGGIVDEAALLAALYEGRVGGAALDVFAIEPLMLDSPWWSAPNTLVTPHVAGFGVRYVERAVAVLMENVARMESGAPLLHVVDRTTGY